MVIKEPPVWAGRALGPGGVSRIEAAIEQAESRTSGEIVPILVRGSSTVGHVALMSFLLIMLIAYVADLPGYGAAFDVPAWLWHTGCWAFAGALAVALSRLDAVARLLTPRIDQIRQVDLRAQVEFYELGVNETEERTGILLFVSLMEHRAVVLADRSIADTVEAEEWQALVDLMIKGVKRGDLSGGFVAAIERCGDILSGHFPIAENDSNELRDHLQIKD